MMKDIRREVIGVLLKQRKKSKMSNRELAYRMGLRERSVGRTMYRFTKPDEFSPKMDSIQQLAEGLGCEVIYTARIILPNGTEVSVSGIIKTD